MFFLEFVKDFFQWWLTSGQILFRRFLAHQDMLRALGTALGVNLGGLLTLYVPINLLIPETGFEKTRSYLKSKFSWINSHLERINGAANNVSNGYLSLGGATEKHKKAVFELVKGYKYDYLTVFGLSVLPIPFLGTAMTAGAIFTVKALEIRFGLLVIVMAKIVKVFALASIAYFAYFL